MGLGVIFPMPGEEDRAMDQTPRDLVIERLEALERQNRLLWRAGVGTVVAAIVFLAEGTSLLGTSKIIEAQGFVLKDASGRVRGQFKTISGGSPEFALLDEEGKDIVKIHEEYINKPSLEILDHGRTRIQLTASSDGSGLLRMADDNDENRLSLFLRRDGTSGQAFESDKRGLHVGVQPDGMAGLCVVDESGKELDRLGLLPDEVQCVRLHDMIFAPGPAPFRKREEPITERSAPLQALYRAADRADDESKAGDPSRGGTPSRQMIH